MVLTKGVVVQRGNKSYIVVDCDAHNVKLQVLKAGRPSRGRPVNMPRARFDVWLDPRAVSQFGCGVELVIGTSKYHLISYDSIDERFTLRGMYADGTYRRGRPRLLYIEDFSIDDQERLKKYLNDAHA